MTLLDEIIQWVLALLSIIMIWKMGNKSRSGPIIGLFSQILWIIYTISTEQWGLLVSALVFTYVHARNAYLWNKKIT